MLQKVLSQNSNLTSLIDIEGEVILEPHPIKFLGFNGLKISDSGEILLAPGYDQIIIMSNNSILVKDNINQEYYSIINLKGDIVREYFTTIPFGKWRMTYVYTKVIH